MSFLSIYVINIILINILIRHIQVYAIDINTSSDFVNALKSEKEVTLNIKNEIVFNQSDILEIGNNISKIKIKGNSPEVSKIVFVNQDSGLLFENSINKIEISDITIESNIFFDNIYNITIENVNFDGYIDANFTLLSDNSFNIVKSIFKKPKIPIEYHLNVYKANILIDQCKFYGNKNLLIGCLNIGNENNKETYGKVTITNSLFDGGYNGRGIIGRYIRDITIKYSEIKNCYNDILYEILYIYIK
ncbi:hypothetical protein H8356DRAFT_927564 [Neocallimastix lanati (nom. inval.)]|nr:hypothetical protein H8356DRAFT_927564 [Neocallimastix sp. JGI-2020a]